MLNVNDLCQTNVYINYKLTRGGGLKNLIK